MHNFTFFITSLKRTIEIQPGLSCIFNFSGFHQNAYLIDLHVEHNTKVSSETLFFNQTSKRNSNTLMHSLSNILLMISFLPQFHSCLLYLTQFYVNTMYTIRSLVYVKYKSFALNLIMVKHAIRLFFSYGMKVQSRVAVATC